LLFQSFSQSCQLPLVALDSAQAISFITGIASHIAPPAPQSFPIPQFIPPSPLLHSFPLFPSFILLDCKGCLIAHGLVISVCIAHHFASGVVTIVCFIVHSGVIIGVASGV
jgi:hypothetical protein